MRILRLYSRLGIAAKLYCVASLLLASIGVLAFASIHFAKTTQLAARNLYEDGFVGVESSTKLELFLEQHRRIVQSSPAEVDRGQINVNRQQLANVSGTIKSLLKASADDDDEGTHVAQGLAIQITELFPELVKRGDRVLFFAYNFAQDKALELSNDYAKIADEIQQKINKYRSERLSIAEKEVNRLVESAGALVSWVIISTTAAILILGPLVFFVTRNVVRRLGRITEAMSRLARYDVAIEVPSVSDNDEVGNMARAVEVFKANAIELIERKAQLERVNLQLDVAMNNMTHGLCMFDSNQRLIVCNERYIQMYHLSPELTKPGTELAEIFSHRTKMGTTVLVQPDRELLGSVGSPAEGKVATIAQELSDGRIIAISQQLIAGGGWVAVHEDITERRRVEAEITHLAHHDPLTNLPNRKLFNERLEHAFSYVGWGESFAVLCVDLDQFKDINDTLGHSIGDELLKLVAQRLRHCTREADTIARLGGDEFAIVQINASPESSSALASRIIETISEPCKIDGHQINIGASVGISLAPGDGDDSDQLLKNADMALYLAKSDGRSTHRFFEPEMDTRLQARRSLEIDLRQAIANGEFQLYYQPIINLKTGKIASLEALLRWNHSKRGLVMPGEFIGLAEETGLITPIGEWVIRQACSDAVSWPYDTKVAINLSPAQFRNSNLVQIIVQALAISNLSPRRLELEITETVLLKNNDANLAMLRQLRGLGVRIAMDDFGTGYSSLSYLRGFPFDKIKIDQSFIRDSSDRNDSAAIMRAIASLAESLNMVTVAEGVETEDQFNRARLEGCTEAQGYYFSRPLPAKDILLILGHWREQAIIAA
jgi:diguanylate cyclase (GGDEF)-like protein